MYKKDYMAHSQYGYSFVYNTIPVTYLDGEGGAGAMDVNGNAQVGLGTLIFGEDSTQNVLGVWPKPIVSGTYAWSPDMDAGTVTKKSVKASAGAVGHIYVTNENAAARYFQLHNKASAPAATEVPLRSYLIPGGASAAIPAILDKQLYSYHSTGVAWAISTTMLTFTDSATASEHDVIIEYA